MGASTDQAHKEVAASRARIDGQLDLLEARLRYDLNPRRRLRREGPKLAAAALVVSLVAVAYVARARRRRRAERTEEVDWIAAMPEEWRARLEELIAEAADSAPARAGRERRPRKRPLLASLGIKAARMAAPALISAASERVSRRVGAPHS